MSLRGNVADLRKLRKRLQAMPATMVHDVARRSAPILTRETRSAFGARRSVYGQGYGRGADGKPLTLERTGLVKDSLRFASTGTVVRCVLGPRYARYLIGRYKILPVGAMPTRWSDQLQQIVSETRLDV